MLETNNPNLCKQRRHNSSYKKLAVKWLNEVLCFVSSSVVADSFALRNRQLLVAAKRYNQLFLGKFGQNSEKCKRSKN
jgi:hypothetical protein